MATRCSDTWDNDGSKHRAITSSIEAKQKDGGDPSEGSVLGSPVPDEEPFSWPGPKTLHLRRTSQGFGFTLRHFIVYPPESAVHNSLKDEENGSRGRQRNRLEPMDTIFVKQVKEGGPAHGAGLCTGDRIVKVNGESIIGKTYSQVIALIQNSDASLELCVMPKDEDILQLFSRDITALAYSQDAYLKGNEAYSGNARNIPAPPPIFYPRIEVKAAAMAQGTVRTAEKNHRVEFPVPPCPPPLPIAVKSVVCNDIIRTTTPSHRTEENRHDKPRSTVPSVSGGVQLQYPSVDTQSPSRTSHGHPEPQSPSVRTPLTSDEPNASPVPSANNTPTHQNIDWKNYTTYKDYIDSKKLHTYGSRTIQERLDSLRAASNANSANVQPARTPPSAQSRRRSASHDRGADARGTAGTSRSVSQERLCGGDGTAWKASWHRSVSQDALPLSKPAGDAKARTRSCDHIEHPASKGATLLPPGCGSKVVDDRAGRGKTVDANGRTASGITTSGNSPLTASVFTKGTDPSKTDGLIMRPSRLPVKNSDFSPALSPAKATAPLKDQRTGATGNHIGYPSPAHLLRTRADSLQLETRAESGLAARSSSCSGPCSKLAMQRQQQTVATVSTNGAIAQQPKAISTIRTSVEGPDATVVVLRRDKNSDAQPHRPPSYVCAVNECVRTQRPPALVKAGSEGAVCRDVHFRRLEDTKLRTTAACLDGSLDSIPFIDEPSSPSIDLDSSHLSASAVMSMAPIITTIPPSPTSPSPLIRRQMSHDQDSLRLTIIDSDSGTKTERSKSCDEGLDNYREERRGRSLIPGLKSLRKAMDRSSEDSGSRRDSSSDIFCDATKEGLLHFKQLSSEKGKRVNMRPWKQMYAVLRGHYLCLYKERREGQVQPGPQTLEEPLAISVRACLIDISYSDTKRKNVLRLTTSDREYLFQAEDRDDMLAWIRVIQDSSSLDQENAAFTSHDLISRKIKEYNTLMSPTGSRSEPSPRSSRQSLSIRHTLLGGKGEARSPTAHSPKAEQERKSLHKDDTSPPKDKGTWRKGIPGLMRKPFEKKASPGVTFGVRLDDCPPAQTNKYVPLIVEVCCKLVEERGLEYTGIYRVPGNNAAISNMQEELNNKGMSDIDIQDDKWRDLNVISSLLKSFFRKLPEPLFTNEKYADFIEANRIEDAVERLKELKRLLHELPDHHYETLKFLSAHLKTVAENSEKNKMEPRNLAIVFGPTLVRTTEDNMTHMVTHMPDQYKIVETLIQNYHWFFTEDGTGEPVTASQEESAVESQPVPNIDHLLTNIGRTTATSQGEVSDSPTSDSAKSKGSWGSGKDQYSRELLVSSIFAAASRKRKKSKEKPQASSSDDDLDSAFPKKDISGPKTNPHSPLTAQTSSLAKSGSRQQENGRSVELVMKTKKEHRNFLKELARHPSPPVMIRLGKPSLSDPPSVDETSDLGTMSSNASTKKPGHSLDPGASAGAEVSSITSDYSTTSSVTFPTGAEPNAMQGGEEADDERSELISEGRPMETDSEGEFPVFAPSGGNSQSTPRQSQTSGKSQGNACTKTAKTEPRRLFASQGDALSRRWSLRHKTDSESSAEGVADSSRRLSRALEAVKKGRSTSSLSSSSRSESERPEPAWHHKIAERFRLRLRTSADDMLSAQKSSENARGGGKKRGIRRRHTMAGQRDFAELATIDHWSERPGDALENFKPRFSSQDWTTKEGARSDTQVAPKAVPEDECPDCDKAPPAASGVNGSRSKAALAADAHPQKLSGAQVVRSRFYQYL